MKYNPSKTRVILEEAKKKKGQSNLGKQLTEQQREKIKRKITSKQRLSAPASNSLEK